MSYVWAKVWIEILYDYKMACLSDHLWRRTIELILLAKELDPIEGHLPDIEEMAFKLHTNSEILEAELNDLAAVGIVELLQDGWFLPNFKDRQGKISGAERVARHRERRKKEVYHEGDTGPLRNGNDVVTSRYTDKDKDKEEEQRGNDSLQGHPVWELPDELNSDTFEAVWISWFKHLLEKGVYLTQTQGDFQLEALAQMGQDRAVAAIKLSMRRGWKSIHEQSQSYGNGQGVGELTKADAAWSEVFGHIQRVGSREQPDFEGVTAKAIRQAGGYTALCQMRERDAENTFKLAYQEAA